MKGELIQFRPDGGRDQMIVADFQLRDDGHYQFIKDNKRIFSNLLYTFRQE
jgi:hypothetical protein